MRKRERVKRRVNRENAAARTHVVGLVVVERELILADERVEGISEADHKRHEHDEERSDVGNNDAEGEDERGELHVEDFKEPEQLRHEQQAAD